MTKEEKEQSRQERFRKSKGAAIYFMVSRDMADKLEAIKELDGPDFNYESFFSPWIALVHAFRTETVFKDFTYRQIAGQFAAAFGLNRGNGDYFDARTEQIENFTELYKILGKEWPDKFPFNESELKEFTLQIKNELSEN